jgi:hypothetical protein
VVEAQNRQLKLDQRQSPRLAVLVEYADIKSVVAILLLERKRSFASDKTSAWLPDTPTECAMYVEGFPLII